MDSGGLFVFIVRIPRTACVAPPTIALDRQAYDHLRSDVAVRGALGSRPGITTSCE